MAGNQESSAFLHSMILLKAMKALNRPVGIPEVAGYIAEELNQSIEVIAPHIKVMLEVASCHGIIKKRKNCYAMPVPCRNFQWAEESDGSSEEDCFIDKPSRTLSINHDGPGPSIALYTPEFLAARRVGLQQSGADGPQLSSMKPVEVAKNEKGETSMDDMAERLASLCIVNQNEESKRKGAGDGHQ